MHCKSPATFVCDCACACDSFNDMVIAGDFNMPKIPWVSLEQTPGAKELSFIEILNDNYLTQMNHFPTRVDNTLDLVITSTPDQDTVNEVLSSEQSGIFSDHNTVSFEYNALIQTGFKFDRYDINRQQ